MVPLRITIAATALLALAFASPGQARVATGSGDMTLSPFFYVQTDDPTIDRLPMKALSADVRVSGVIADVTIRQTYTNVGEAPLEATYVFPASTRAAVYGMKMVIGSRRITAEINTREDALAIYEEAKEEGQTASLLEQSRPNVFQMSIANILPGDTIDVELHYTELLVPTEAMYEFVYPTVVGPRYSEVPISEADETDLFVATPYTHAGEAPLYTFDVAVSLAAGMPIRLIECPTHVVSVDQPTPEAATVSLDPTESDGGNRDYILRYRLAGDEIASGLLLYEGENENFFLFMGQPPARVTDAEIPPREYVFIMDVSGSMGGFPTTVSKALLSDLVGGLRPQDTFNVLMFAGGSTVLWPQSLSATAENIAAALYAIDNQHGSGGTRIVQAMARALAMPRSDAPSSRTFVVATDGYVSAEAATFDTIRANLG